MYCRATKNGVTDSDKKELFFGEGKLTYYGLFGDSAVLFLKQ
jgi:hypothetical protein